MNLITNNAGLGMIISTSKYRIVIKECMNFLAKCYTIKIQFCYIFICFQRHRLCLVCQDDRDILYDQAEPTICVIWTHHPFPFSLRVVHSSQHQKF